MSSLVTTIDVERQHGNLSSCLRLFVLEFYRYQLAEAARAREPAPDAAPVSRPAESA